MRQGMKLPNCFLQCVFRFARAKGSKSSNERIPNEATPWHVMKQQLVENLSKSQEVPEKTKSAKELLCDKQDTSDTIRSTNSNWAEFENNYEKKNNSAAKETGKKKHNKLHKGDKNQNTFSREHNDNPKKLLKRNIDEVDNSMPEKKLKKHKKGNNQYDNTNDSQKNETNTKTLVENNNLQVESETSNIPNSENKTTFSKRQKRNMRRKNIVPETKNGTNNVNNDTNESTENNQANRYNKKFGYQSTNFRNAPHKFVPKKFENNKAKQKPPKIRDDKEHKRRKPDTGYTKLVINGVELEIVRFDGFPIKKEDAERLHDLRQQMIIKGIPQKEINAAMKLERRKAEKALARIKKCVCFHCRKSGHNLSDCPELGSEQAGTGICFKCGSTEHTHFECKVARPTEFRYATCFICREQGHIAKQCPDNPKGVYPQGGCCKICGDVTHLKKDCPDLIKVKEESTVTVNTIANGDIESLEENRRAPNENSDTVSKKIVKF